MKPTQSDRQKRQKLLRDLFRNALAIAVLKQGLVAGGAPFSEPDSDPVKDRLPPYFLG